MHNKIAAFLTVKLDASFALPLTPKTAENVASQFDELSLFAVSEMERWGAIRTNLVLDVVQAVLNIEDNSRADVFHSARKIVYGLQTKLVELHRGNPKKHAWAGLAIGPVLFDDKMLFGDAVTDSVLFSEAAYKSNAIMVASSELVPDNIGEYQLSKIGTHAVVVINEPSRSGQTLN